MVSHLAGDGAGDAPDSLAGASGAVAGRETEGVAVIERVWNQTSSILCRTLATEGYTFVGKQFGVQ
jgi:hypothetical protein